ncbi:hypothetical protein PybrP1_003249 [[Pythium] brassicae (nom. inval.)]|nr:hypothetical protein PybrP1_003249 [[Pythium] brassicae (nom. inval.)]
MAHLVRAWDQQPDGYEVLDGPSDTESFASWHRDWAAWRRMELRANRYDGGGACDVYNIPRARWTQSSFLQVLVMLSDRAIYDRARDAYTVDSFLDATEARVGPVDSVLLWASYPNLGIDSRNQWDLLRALPGGIEGLARLVAQFHARNVRVLLPYNPWDTATRDEPGRERSVRMYSADAATLTQLLAATGADGFNGDTMYGVPKAFYNCSAGPLVAAPEGGVPTAYLSHNPMSWGYLLGYAHFPPVARAKFLEPRHMVQVCARWSQNRVVELQAAFFNGAGFVLWENVWGIWHAMTAREDAAAKRALAVLRQFAFATASAQWRPYAFGSRADQVVASEFPAPERGGWLYTVVSSSARDATFRLPLSAPQTTPGTTVYDVYHGSELRVQQARDGNGNGSVVQIELEPFGFGAIFVAASGKTVDGLDAFLAAMRAMTGTRLADLSMHRPLLKQTLVSSDPPMMTTTTAATQANDESEDEMVRVTGSDAWWFNVSGVQIEPVAAWTPTQFEFGTGVQFPWEHRPWNNHSVRLAIQDFRLDRHPVTNAAYARFLAASQYQPRTLQGFLAHWENRVDAASGAYTALATWQVPPALAQSPVVHVSREDADAFARFYGKRLPHDWEWQYVASNGDQYDAYPWGNDFADGATLHRVSRGKHPPAPDAVGAHPASRSRAFGVDDLVGYVWQMTDQFCDAHTCGQLLRGGSFYQPVASTLSDPNWYFPQALASYQHNRFLMTSESYDRSAFIGFRCAQSG